MKVQIRQYITLLGVNYFEKWFDSLDSIAAAKITAAIYRLELGNYSNVKNLKDGVFEYKIDFGPGYRIYFGQDGDELIILLGGGSKKKQDSDIKRVKKYWAEYKLIKRQEKRS